MTRSAKGYHGMLPEWCRSSGAARKKVRQMEAYTTRQLGTFGAASECVSLTTGKTVERAPQTQPRLAKALRELLGHSTGGYLERQLRKRRGFKTQPHIHVVVDQLRLMEAEGIVRLSFVEFADCTNVSKGLNPPLYVALVTLLPT